MIWSVWKKKERKKRDEMEEKKRKKRDEMEEKKRKEKRSFSSCTLSTRLPVSSVSTLYLLCDTNKMCAIDSKRNM